MEDFLDESILLPTILKLEVDSSEYDRLPQTIKNLKPPLKFPIIKNPSEIDEIFKNSETIATAIEKTDFDFEFSIEIVSTLCSFFSTSINSAPNYTVILAFNSYFALLKSCANIEHIPMILELLKMIVLFPVPQEYRYYAASAFASMYNFEKFISYPKDMQPYLQPFGSFFTDIDDLPQSGFDLIARVGEIINARYAPKILDVFFKYIDPVINRCHEKIPISTIKRLIKVIEKTSLCLAPSCISIVKKINQHYSSDHLLSYINMIPQQIWNKINKTEVISKPIKPLNDLIKKETIKGSVLNRMNVSNGRTFQGTVDIETMDPYIPAYESIECMINPSIKEILDNVSDLLKTDEVLCINFIDNTLCLLSVIEETDDHKVDKVAAFVYIYQKNEEIFAKSKANQIIFSSFVFDPRITFFDANESFLPISTLRNSILYLFSLFEIEKVQIIFKDLIEYPLLIAEVFLRMYLQENITFPDIKSEPTLFPMTITKFMHTYRIATSEKDNREAICQARIALFYFLRRLLDDQDNLNAFLSYERFINEIALMIFENPTRKIALDFFIDYMGTIEGSLNLKCLLSLKMQFISIFAIPLTSVTIDCGTQFAIALSQLAVKFPFYVESFGDIVDEICNRLSDIEPVDIARDYFMSVVNLMRVICKQRPTTQREFVQIETGAKRIFGKNVNYSILRSLLELVAGTKLKNIRYPFDVLQPKGLSTLLKVFEDTPLIFDVLNIIKQLCDFSEENKNDFHDYEFDLCIIEFIEESNNNEILDLALDILQSISSCSSSATVVNRFISLFCPVKEEFLKPYHEPVLDFFNDVISDASTLPECGYPICPDSVAVIQGLPSKLFEKSTFIFWIFSTEEEGETTLAVLKDEGGLSIRIILADGKLTSSVKYHSKSWKGPSQLEIPLNKWFKVSIMFLSGGEKADYYNVYIWCDSELYQRQVFPYLPIKSGKMKVKIGDRKNKTDGTMIGPFGFFNVLSEDAINIVFETNPHTVPYDLNPYIYVTPQKDGDKIALRSYPAFDISYVMVKNPKPFTFIDIISSRIGYSILAPLYAEMNFKYENGEEFSRYAVKVTQLLRNAFALNPRGQREFYNNKGFVIISYLLRSANTSQLTFELYTSFVGLAATLTDPPLIERLFVYILANFALWKESEDIEKITQHWGYSLFQSLPELACKAMPFDQIIRILRSYFYYKPIEAGIAIRLQNRDTIEKNLEKIRKNLIVAAFSIAKVTPIQDVIKVLVTNILTSGEIEQQIELLNLLLEILSIPIKEEPKSKSNENNNFYQPLHLLNSLMGTKNGKVIALLLRVIIKMHEVFDIKEVSFDEHIQLISEQLPQSAVSNELFELVLDIVKETPVMFSFLCYIAYNLGPEAEDRVFDSCEPSEELTKAKFWTVWPAMIFVHSNGLLRIKIINFIIALGCHVWMPFLNSVDFVGRSIDTEVFKSEHDFIIEAAANILLHPDEITEEEVDAFLDLIRNFVFLKPYGYVCDGVRAIDETFAAELNKGVLEETEANEGISALKQSINNIALNGNQDQSGTIHAPFKLAIANISKDEPRSKATKLMLLLKDTKMERHFGIRFSEAGEWMDADLVKMALDIYELKPIPKHISTTIIICAYLLRSSTERAVMFMAPYVMKRDLPDEICIYNERAYKTHNTILGSTNRNDTVEDALEQYEQFSENDSRTAFAKEFFEFFEATVEKEHKLLDLTHEKLIETVLHNTNMMQENFSNAYFATRKIWRRIWRSMTIDGFPWSSSIIVDEEVTGNTRHVLKKKREPAVCAFSAPMNIKRYYGQVKQRNISFKALSPISECSEEGDEAFSNEINRTQFPVDDSTECVFIGLNKSDKGLICIQSDSIKLLKGKQVKKIKPESIVNIFIKTWFKKPTALEIQLDNGQTYFIDMKEGDNIDFIESLSDFSLSKLTMRCQLTNFSMKDQFEKSGMTEQWATGKISTFEYLLSLNLFSGRTFNSIMQYPIFPWILAEYNGETLNTNDPSMYRDLSKPVGALDEERYQELVARAKDRKEHWLYDSTYSTPSNVCNLLARIEPFASLTNERVTSLQKEFNIARTALGNYTELTPEFFYSPEVVENMELPPWAKSPFDFVYMHRKALESVFVSSNINKWIDLIWGKDQKGPQKNLFDPDLYTSNNPDEANVNHLTLCGQIPIQMFTSRHPKRSPKKIMPPEVTATVRLSDSNLVGAVFFKYAKYQINVLGIENDGDMFAFKLTADFIKGLAKKKKDVDLSQFLHRNLNLQSFVHNENEGLLIFSKRIPKFDKIYKDSFERFEHISPLLRGSFVVIGGDEDDAYIVNPASNSITKLPTNEVYCTCAASNENYTVLADCESMIYVFKDPNFTKPQMALQISTAQVKCLAVSAKFHLVACASKEDSIFLLSLTSKTVSRIVDLSRCHATSVIITPSWGLVIAFTKGFDDKNTAKTVYKVYVITCNGEIVKTAPIKSEPVAITQYTDSSGFDHVIYADENEDIYEFEAYYPEEKRQITTDSLDVISVEAWTKMGLCAVLSRDAVVHFYPLI